MNSVVKQKYYIFLEIHLLVGGQRLLTNTDTAEQLLLEGSQDQDVQNQWKEDIPVGKSAVF